MGISGFEIMAPGGYSEPKYGDTKDCYTHSGMAISLPSEPTKKELQDEIAKLKRELASVRNQLFQERNRRR